MKMKKDTRRKLLAACGLVVAIAVAVVIAYYVGYKDVNHQNYGNTITQPR